MVGRKRKPENEAMTWIQTRMFISLSTDCESLPALGRVVIIWCNEIFGAVGKRFEIRIDDLNTIRMILVEFSYYGAYQRWAQTIHIQILSIWAPET